MSRGLAFLFAAGASLVGVSLLLPHGSNTTEASVVVAVGLAYCAAALLVRFAGRLSAGNLQLILALGTVLALMAGGADPVWTVTTLAIVLVTAAWIFVGWTRVPRPRRDHQRRLLVFFVGLVALASILMLRQPLFFIVMIAGFFYAT